MTASDVTPASAGFSQPLAPDELRLIDAYWRAANYLSVGQIYLLDNPLLREPLEPRARQAAAARPLGHDARAQPHLRPPQPGDPATRPRRDLRHRARARRARRWSPTPTSRAPTARSTPTSPGRGGDAAAVPPVLLPGRHPEPRRARDPRLDPRGRRARLRALARLRRRVRQPRPAGRRGRRRRRGRDRDRWPRAGTRTSSSTRRPTAPSCRSCTSTATRSPTRPCWRASRRTSCGSCSAATATRRTSSRATTRTSVHQQLAATLDTVLDEIHADPDRRPATDGVSERPAWPMIVLRTPKGWTGPPEIDGKQTEGYVALPPGAAGRGADKRRSTAQILETWMRSYRPEELFDDDGAAVARARRAGAHGRPAHERQPARQRRRCSCATCACPTSATTRSTSRAPGPRPPRRPASSARTCATSSDAQPRDVPDLRPRRDPVEPPGRRVRGHGPPVGRRDPARRTSTWRPTGRVMEVLSEHQCQGWLEGYLLTGRHGLFNCYEAFIHIVDSMFNQHAKWLKVTRRYPVAAADRVAQLPAELARLAAGPQRVHPPGPGLHRPRREQEGRGRPRLPAARRQHAAVA